MSVLGQKDDLKKDVECGQEQHGGVVPAPIVQAPREAQVPLPTFGNNEGGTVGLEEDSSGSDTDNEEGARNTRKWGASGWRSWTTVAGGLVGMGAVVYLATRSGDDDNDKSMVLRDSDGHEFKVGEVAQAKEVLRKKEGCMDGQAGLAERWSAFQACQNERASGRFSSGGRTTEDEGTQVRERTCHIFGEGRGFAAFFAKGPEDAIETVYDVVTTPSDLSFRPDAAWGEVLANVGYDTCRTRREEMMRKARDEKGTGHGTNIWRGVVEQTSGAGFVEEHCKDDEGHVWYRVCSSLEEDGSLKRTATFRFFADGEKDDRARDHYRALLGGRFSQKGRGEP